MDYMREINAFYDLAETSELSPSCILLWHALMFQANKAWWPDRLAVPMSVLEIRTGMKVTAIKEARARLKQLGIIDFESRKGNQSALYILTSICGRLTAAIPATTAATTPAAIPATTAATVATHIPTYPSDTPVTKTKTKTNTTARPAKKAYAEYVTLTEAEYAKLVAELGEVGSMRCIEILDGYKGAKGVTYKDDYRAIRNWVIDRYREDQRKQTGGNGHAASDEPTLGTVF